MHVKGLVLSVISAATLFGCAPISRESCINDSAFDIGYSAAMDNADSEDRRRDVSKVCAKQGREIDQAEYSEGFDNGVKAFCVADNGYRWGLKGRGYNGICASSAFGAAYDDGLRIYRVEQRRTAIGNRLISIRDRLSIIMKVFDEDKALTETRKRELRREEDSLLLERSDFLAEQQNLSPS